jgi:hypothetical protein
VLFLCLVWLSFSIYQFTIVQPPPTTKKAQRNERGEMNNQTQTRKRRNRQTNKQKIPGSGAIEIHF